ncbi:MAG: type II secretion system F family protein [Micrococcaceae bacterium]
MLFYKPIPRSWNKEKSKPNTENNTIYKLDVSLCLELTASVMKTGCSLIRSLELLAKVHQIAEKKELQQAITLLRLGSSWNASWQHSTGEIKELSQHLYQANQGISITNILKARAYHYRKNQENLQLERIEALSVKLLMPLGLLALPAFIAIGIIPTILCLFNSISIF